MSLSMIPPCMVWPAGPLVPLGGGDALDDDLVAFLGMTLAIRTLVPLSLPAMTRTVSPDLELHHSTSGASETIRMNFLSRSSRPTGPKMRVPRGCCWSLMITQALSSKRM